MAKGAKTGGRRKGTPNKVGAEVRDLARVHTQAAIARLAYWMASDDPRASVPAATALLDRGHGKPTQLTELTGKDGGPVESKTTVNDERAAIRSEIAKMLAPADTPAGNGALQGDADTRH